MKTLISLVGLLVAHRSLLLALVAFGRDLVEAMGRDSAGGRRIDIAERQALTTTFWQAYDKAVGP